MQEAKDKKKVSEKDKVEDCDISVAFHGDKKYDSRFSETKFSSKKQPELKLWLKKT